MSVLVPPMIQGAMSTEAITVFKAEYQDISLSEKPAIRNKISTSYQRRRPYKFKTEFADTENTFPNATSTQTLPNPSPKHLLLIPTKNTGMEQSDPALSPSQFVLRELVPRAWVPPVSLTGPAQTGSHSAPQLPVSDPYTRISFENYTPPAPRFPQLTHIFDTSLPAPYTTPDIPRYSRIPSHDQQQPQPQPCRPSNLDPAVERTPHNRLLPSLEVPLSEPSAFTSGHTFVHQLFPYLV